MNSQFQLYNSMVRCKEAFVPINPQNPKHVRMYVCGMTVYDYCHLGHARVMVVFDVLRRWLRALGYTVTYVRNITDIDDKIIRRAVENQETLRSLTDRFIAAMHEDADALGIERPDHEPRATEYVAHMQSMIQTLMSKRLAYQDDSGDVNYAVREFPAYGRLSGKSVDDLRAGERVGVSDSKRDPLDFVLWKAAKANEPTDAVWPSPFGPGRPGWHIECSAMSCQLLGESFDIHGGGADLQFPHHENEIAQSVGAHGGGFARYWVHNGFVRVETEGRDEKMSKSLGNFFTIRDILQSYDAEVVRFFILRAQYRSPLTYSAQHLADARAALGRLYTAVGDVEPLADVGWQQPFDAREFESRFAAAMNDDLNTPLAVSVLFELAAEVNRKTNEGDPAEVKNLAQRLKALGGVLGLLGRTATAYHQAVVGADQGQAQQGLSAQAIEAQIAARAQAKACRDFARADAIRQELLAQGVVLEDVRGGPTQWRRA